jgi:dihydropyrimidine dehydrogenase (NAD+) subunit PreA
MKNYNYDAALTEATRCLMCHDAPCHSGCPSKVNPKLFIRKIKFGDMAGAVRLLRNANVLSASCAYICPCMNTCCGECTSEKLDRPIDIIGLQRYVMTWEREHGVLETVVAEKNGKKVAVIGSGPAGLACASKLAVKGYDVHVFEREHVAGGQLKLSIPDFRLPQEVIDFETNLVQKLGVTFHFGATVQDTETLKKEGFESIFVATGLMGSRNLNIDGEDKKGVYQALDFLIRAKKGESLNIGKRVLVVGGGDTAIDAARVAAKMGAQVLMLYRRTQKDMPAYRPDIEEAFSDGVEMWFRVVPVAITGEANVSGMRLQRVSWKGEGRYVKDYDVEGPEFEIQADTVINAVGQTKDHDFGLDKADPTTFKVAEGLYVGGDFAHGAGTAVAAIGQGNNVALEIDKFLTNSPETKDQSPKLYKEPNVDLSIEFCGVKFENPFILAAAPPTDELEMVRNGFKAGWAGAVLKTTSTEETIVDLKYPMMTGRSYEGKRVSALGNIDLISEYHIDVVEKRVKILKEEFPNKVVIASIMGGKKEDWQTLVKRLSDAGVDMIECSFSCPQGSLGAKPGQMLAQDPALAGQVAGWVKDAAKAHPRNVPVVMKITPHVTDICDVAQEIKNGGADAVCASNTIQSLMGIDLDTFIPNPNVNGKSTYSGMSGPAIKPLTLKVISEISKKVGIPITGTGGPVDWRDVVEFMACGATTVQFCTAVMHYGYDIIDDLKDGLAQFLQDKGFEKPADLIGKSLPYITGHDELPYDKKVLSKIDNDKCICCDLCHIACRDGGHMAIEVGDNRKPIVDEEKCVGCAMCKYVCPVSGCIEIESK